MKVEELQKQLAESKMTIDRLTVQVHDLAKPENSERKSN